MRGERADTSPRPPHRVSFRFTKVKVFAFLGQKAAGAKVGGLLPAHLIIETAPPVRLIPQKDSEFSQESSWVGVCVCDVFGCLPLRAMSSYEDEEPPQALMGRRGRRRSILGSDMPPVTGMRDKERRLQQRRDALIGQEAHAKFTAVLTMQRYIRGFMGRMEARRLYEINRPPPDVILEERRLVMIAELAHAREPGYCHAARFPSPPRLPQHSDLRAPLSFHVGARRRAAARSRSTLDTLLNGSYSLETSGPFGAFGPKDRELISAVLQRADQQRAAEERAMRQERVARERE